MFYNKLKDDKNLLFVRQTARKLTAVSSITFLLSIKLESVTSYHMENWETLLAIQLRNLIMKITIIVLLVFYICASFAFQIKSSRHILSSMSKTRLDMKWVFTKGTGSVAEFQELGGIGSQGELYYIPTKRPILRAPSSCLGKEVNIPIFPRNSVLGPMGEEYLGVYEMRYRQLINDIGENGIFGHVYYSQENAKLALVGTLEKIKRIERLEDGAMYVLSEGIGRFYLKEFKSERPYLKAKIQIFHDFSDNERLIQILEKKLFDEIRYSVKLMKILYPYNNYTMNYNVILNRPLQYSSHLSIRNVILPQIDTETIRRSKFSFAAMDMLKIDAITKLLFLQEPVLEKRYEIMLKVSDDILSYLIYI